MTFTDADAKRMLTIIDERIEQYSRRNLNRFPWGVVSTVNRTTRAATVFLLGDTVASVAIRFRADNTPRVGQLVKTGIDPRGERWIEAIWDGADAAIARSARTSFPSSPVSGDICYRTDLKYEFYWDGTLWLSTQQFYTALEPSARTFTASTGEAARMALPHFGLAGIVVGQVRMTAVVATTWDASNYWYVELKTAVGTTNTSLGSVVADPVGGKLVNVWYEYDDFDFLTDGAVSGAQTWLSMHVVKVGSPGAFSPLIGFYWRKSG